MDDITRLNRMNEMILKVKTYFNAWIINDASVLSSLFDSNITYTECYGPEYHGIEQILQWFSDWHLKGDVMEWSIKQYISQNDVMVVEWYFQCNYDNNLDGFDGVSLITFDEKNKMTLVKEFQSKSLHYCPYE